MFGPGRYVKGVHPSSLHKSSGYFGHLQPYSSLGGWHGSVRGTLLSVRGWESSVSPPHCDDVVSAPSPWVHARSGLQWLRPSLSRKLGKVWVWEKLNPDYMASLPSPSDISGKRNHSMIR